MQVLVRGHRYVVNNHEDTANGQTIQFIHKEPVVEGSIDLETVCDGTTNEEVLRVLIDRMNMLQSSHPCRENAIVITKLEESLMWLKWRLDGRIARGVYGTNAK